jgi:hypothetical protein
MAISVEYLAILRGTDTFCDTAAAFTRLLQVNSDIVVDGGTIDFKKKCTCKYELTSGDVAGKGQRYFQLKFTWDGDPEAAPKDLAHFLSMLRAIRTVISNIGGEAETLRDDVSSHYSRKSYPLIHDIENLMRRLIANFMLLNVGIEWTAEALPSDVEEAVRKSKRRLESGEQPKKTTSRDYLNVLHTLDFIHLGNIMFDAYSKKLTSDLYIKLRDVKTVADAKALQDFIPQSNWTRYFAQLIECDDLYLETRWKKFYLLRCKVAHNALMNAQDFADIEKLIGEVKPKLEQAIGELPQVMVPPGEVESVAESAARNVNAAIGDFVSSWQQMEAAIARRMETLDGKRKPIIPSADELRQRTILDEWRIGIYEEVRLFRNRIVHGPAHDMPLEKIQAATANIRRLIECIQEESFIAKLKAMSEIDRDSTLDALVADSAHEITESDEFCSAQATSNATWFGIDEYEIEDIEIGQDDCTAKLSYGASGEHLEDKPHFGNRSTGEADVVFDWDGGITFQNVSAQIDHGDNEEDEFDPSRAE